MSDLKPCDKAMQPMAASGCSVKLRRVVVDIRVMGTDDDADAVRDKLGQSLTDEIIMPEVVEVMESRGIEGVKWEVRGESWISQNDEMRDRHPQPDADYDGFCPQCDKAMQPMAADSLRRRHRCADCSTRLRGTDAAEPDDNVIFGIEDRASPEDLKGCVYMLFLALSIFALFFLFVREITGLP